MEQVVSAKRVNPPAKMLTFLSPGLLLGISGGGVPLACPNPDPVLDSKNVIFHTRFQTRPLRNYVIKDSNRKRFLKIHFEFAYFSFFLTLLELKRCVQTRPQLP